MMISGGICFLFVFVLFFFPFGSVLVADFLKIFYESLSGGQGLKLFSQAMPKYSSLLGFLVMRFLHVAEALPFSLGFDFAAFRNVSHVVFYLFGKWYSVQNKS